MNASANASSRWLWGATPDLLFGCGVWYLLAFLGFCVGGSSIRTGGGLEYMPLLVLVFGTPHYGATLLRVYRNASDRDAYRFFTVYASLALLAVFAVGIHNAWVGSAILTLYLTWSPWHYTGQNYGIAVMLLRKRGAVPAPGLKRILYLSFFLSFLLTFLAQHGGGAGSAFAPLSYEGAGYVFLPIGLPDPWVGWAIAGVGAAYLATWLVAAAGLVRAGGFRACGPALLLMFSQSLWFSIPLAARHWSLGQQFDPLSRDWADYYFFWIAIAHSIQYLWVTSYYARSSGGGGGIFGYSAQAMLAGALIWVAPTLVFAPDLLGRLSFDAGLGILVASTVNIHHFILDGAIWKLRDGRVARILMRPRAEQPEGGIEPESSRWRLGLVAAAGALCTFLLFYGEYEKRRAETALRSGDLAGAQTAITRLDWMGRTSAHGHRALGDLLVQNGDDTRAEAEYLRSLELQSTPVGWQSVGSLRVRRGDLLGAAAAYEQGLALGPNQDVLQYEAGVVALRMGEFEKARDFFAQAAASNPRRGIYRKMLEQAEAKLADRP